ncbi:hypothetical protein [Streptomyces fuscichromogenes]|uniref:DUF4386 domain-containing protein n=1 Tax=Streptomyces fuscichromogenes TaxID=1324013 RepID=A0A917XBC1_9ACTN|nr:hypothetical protein [Streptomyces fuscichromogenes]GGN05198.1 hypothetical protein GCM10011578_028830 [Streptomyces fuscichromogenes]
MSRRILTVCASFGYLFIGLFFAALLIAHWIPPMAPSWSAERVAAFYTDHANSIRAGLVVMLVGAVATAPFVAALSSLIRRIDSRLEPLAAIQLVCGAANVAAIFVPVLIFTATAYRPDRSPDITMALNDTAWIMLVMNAFPAVGQAIVVGVAILADKRPTPLLPRWAAYLNFWMAFLFLPSILLTFFKTGPFAWNGILSFWVAAGAFGVWFLVMTPLMMRAAKRVDDDRAPAVLEPVA